MFLDGHTQGHSPWIRRELPAQFPRATSPFSNIATSCLAFIVGLIITSSAVNEVKHTLYFQWVFNEATNAIWSRFLMRQFA